jgi:hypothetical protein
VVALAIAYSLLNAKYDRLEAENLKLKKDFRVLEVTDPNLLHAIGFYGDTEETYRFRFYIPPDKKFVLHYVFGPVPKTGYDIQFTKKHSHGHDELSSDMFKDPNHEVSIQLQPTDIVMNLPNSRTLFPHSIEYRKGVSGQATTDGLVATEETQRAQPGEKLELMRQHTRHTVWDSNTEKWIDIEDGILLWIEEVPQSVIEQRKKDEEMQKAIMQNTRESSKKP